MTDTPHPTPKAAAFKAKGNATMPPRQTIHAPRGSKSIRRLTRAFRWATDTTRLTPEQRSALAFFSMRYEVGERPE